MTHSKLSFGQIVFEVGTSHLTGFAEIHSGMPTEQYSVLWKIPETQTLVNYFSKTS